MNTGVTHVTDRLTVGGKIACDLLSIVDLLDQAQLARICAYLYREGEATVSELIDAFDLSQGTAYTCVNRSRLDGLFIQ